MGGMETIQRIRSHENPAIAATPVIAITALAMPADRERCLQAGANEYMSKPLKLEELILSMQKLLEAKQ
jgi:CheY-like chemotaxis protein